MVFTVCAVMVDYVADEVDELHCLGEGFIVPCALLPPFCYQRGEFRSRNQMGLLWLVDGHQSGLDEEIVGGNRYIAEREHLDDEAEEEPGLEECFDFGC